MLGNKHPPSQRLLDEQDIAPLGTPTRGPRNGGFSSLELGDEAQVLYNITATFNSPLVYC